MEQHTQTELLRELLELQAARQPNLAERWVTTDIEKYLQPERFEQERRAVLARQPRIVLHASELPEPGAYRTVEQCGRPLLIVRGQDQVVRAFLNVCRHRGARLVGDGEGCRRRFTCPYHAWTYSDVGELVGIPHGRTGFEGLDRAAHGLTPVPCVERAGWIWVIPTAGASMDLSAHLGELDGEIVGLQAQDMTVFCADDLDLQANWKLIVEGGLEAYHFRVAHRETIAPLFLDNLSSYRCFGPHMRSVLPRSHLADLAGVPEGQWRIGEYANVLYTLFPVSQFLVQHDHLVWIQADPLAPDRTRLRISTVIDRSEQVPERRAHWERNHALTMVTLGEDFALAEGIQAGLDSGANTQLNFGRFEGALDRFNQTVLEMLGATDG